MINQRSVLLCLNCKKLGWVALLLKEPKQNSFSTPLKKQTHMTMPNQGGGGEPSLTISAP